MKSIKKKQNKIRPWLKSLLGCRVSTTIFSPKGPRSFPFSLAPVVTPTLLPKPHSPCLGGDGEGEGLCTVHGSLGTRRSPASVLHHSGTRGTTGLSVVGAESDVSPWPAQPLTGCLTHTICLTNAD